MHSQKPRLTADALRRLAFERHLPHRTVHFQHFEDAQPAPVALVMAMRTTASAGEVGLAELIGRQSSRLDLSVGWTVRLLAFWTNLAHQTLRHDGNYAGCHQERLDPDINQACNSTRRIVRV